MATILNTRAQLQAKDFSLALQKANHTSIECPAITITPKKLKDLELEGFDIIIFVSQNAALLALPYITPKWEEYNIFSVGPATKAALPDFLAVKHPPIDFSTRGLLAMLEQVAAKKIAIICGDDTKQELIRELTARKGLVATFAIYRRTLCSGSIAKIQQLPEIDIITSFSPRSLQALNEIILSANMEALKTKPLVVTTTHMVTLALELKFNGKVYLSKDPTVAAVLAAIQEITGG